MLPQKVTTMPNVTLAIPEEVHEKMKQHSEMRWSEFMRKALVEKIKLLEIVESIAQKSKLTEEDVKALAKKIDRAVARKHGIL